MFDDSLTREELEKVISLSREDVNNNFNSFKESILDILSEKESVPIIWNNELDEKNEEGFDDKNSINQNDRVLNRLATSYSRSFAYSANKEVSDL